MSSQRDLKQVLTDKHLPAQVEYLQGLVKVIPSQLVLPPRNQFQEAWTEQFSNQFKRVTYTFSPSRFKKLELLHVTDVQFGHFACNYRRMIEYRDWILAEPNRFMLWGGDMCDFGTKISVGSPWEQIAEPKYVLDWFTRIWAPAAHRVLGFVGGNHERRTTVTFGETGSEIARRLGVPYSAGKQYIDIQYGEHQNFTIALWHGGGAAGTPGAKLNVLTRFMQDGDSQLYLIGHLHEPLVRFYARVLRKPDGKIKLVKVGGAMSSSFLDYWNTYSEVANLTASPLMMARIILEPNGHWELTLR